MTEYPSREDMAAELIRRTCGNNHDFPEESWTATEFELDEVGRRVNIRRVSCARCGLIRVTRWNEPERTGGVYAILSTSSYEDPEPGDLPDIGALVRRITDEEYAEFVVAQGFTEPPRFVAPDRRATAVPERREVRLRIRGSQFHLLDYGGSPLATILPIPPHAESADTIAAVRGAALFWTPMPDGELVLTVVISPTDPGPDRSYPHIAELSCRYDYGHVVLHELAGSEVPLPPLPGGHGDYRLRFHTAESACLLQMWNQPRTKPLVHPA
ncbi:hypothetical protein [Nocardia heshunensis]